MSNLFIILYLLDLASVELQYNSLTGEIPTSFSKLQNMKTMVDYTNNPSLKDNTLATTTAVVNVMTNTNTKLTVAQNMLDMQMGSTLFDRKLRRS